MRIRREKEYAIAAFINAETRSARATRPDPRQSSIDEALQEEFDSAAASKIYFEDTSQGQDPQLYITFSDKTALQAVRLRHFLHDCHHYQGDLQKLARWADQERQVARTYLQDTYQDIMEHFDPKVVRFRKKRRILLSDRAAKDLL